MNPAVDVAKPRQNDRQTAGTHRLLPNYSLVSRDVVKTKMCPWKKRLCRGMPQLPTVWRTIIVRRFMYASTIIFYNHFFIISFLWNLSPSHDTATANTITNNYNHTATIRQQQQPCYDNTRTRILKWHDNDDNPSEGKISGRAEISELQPLLAEQGSVEKQERLPVEAPPAWAFENQEKAWWGL